MIVANRIDGLLDVFVISRSIDCCGIMSCEHTCLTFISRGARPDPNTSAGLRSLLVIKTKMTMCGFFYVMSETALFWGGKRRTSTKTHILKEYGDGETNEKEQKIATSIHFINKIKYIKSFENIIKRKKKLCMQFFQ